MGSLFQRLTYQQLLYPRLQCAIDCLCVEFYLHLRSLRYFATTVIRLRWAERWAFSWPLRR
jgi:hypothetical protein